MPLFSRKTFHTIFEAGVLIKAIDSVAEMALGAFFYFLSPRLINNIIFSLSGDELTEKQRDPIWNFFFHHFASVTANTLNFWAFLLIGHGILKLLLVAGLLKNKLWIYPASAIAFSFFALYQAYTLIYAPSALLTVLTLFDVIFIALILHEYSYQKNKRGRI